MAQISVLTDEVKFFLNDFVKYFRYKYLQITTEHSFPATAINVKCFYTTQTIGFAIKGQPIPTREANYHLREVGLKDQSLTYRTPNTIFLHRIPSTINNPHPQHQDHPLHKYPRFPLQILNIFISGPIITQSVVNPIPYPPPPPAYYNPTPTSSESTTSNRPDSGEFNVNDLEFTDLDMALINSFKM